MSLPGKPVTLSARKISEIEKKLARLRHEVNNNLTLIVAAAEMLRRRPDPGERVWETLEQKPLVVADRVAEFTRHLEKALHLRRD